MSLASAYNYLLKGRVKGETVPDLLHLCNTMVVAYLANNDPDVSAADFTADDGVFEQRVDAAGKILCAIFDPVKTPEYRKGMIEVRLSYHGIASDLGLQSDYAERIRELTKNGSLESVDVAVEAEIWRFLGRGQATA